MLDLFANCAIEELEVLSYRYSRRTLKRFENWNIRVFKDDSDMDKTDFLEYHKDTLEELKLNETSIEYIETNLKNLKKLDASFRSQPTKNLMPGGNTTLQELSISTRYYTRNYFCEVLKFYSSIIKLRLKAFNHLSYSEIQAREINNSMLKCLDVQHQTDPFLNFSRFDNLERLYIRNFSTFFNNGLQQKTVIPSVRFLIIYNTNFNIDEIVQFYPGLETLKIKFPLRNFDETQIRRALKLAKNLKILEIPSQFWPFEMKGFPGLKIKFIK